MSLRYYKQLILIWPIPVYCVFLLLSIEKNISSNEYILLSSKLFNMIKCQMAHEIAVQNLLLSSAQGFDHLHVSIPVHVQY